MSPNPDFNNQTPNFSCKDLGGQKFNGMQLQRGSFVNIRTGVKWQWEFISYLLSFSIGCLLGFLSSLISYYLLDLAFLSKAIGLGSLVILIYFWLILRQSGPSKAIIWTTSIVAVYGTFMGVFSVASKAPEIGRSTLLFASTFTLILGCLFLGIVCCAGTRLVISRWMIACLYLGSALSGVAVSTFGSGSFGKVIRQSGSLGITLTLLFSLLIASICQDMSRRVLLDIPDFRTLRRWAIIWSTFGNTNFQKANLSSANFSGASLAGANFSGTILDYVDWSKAQGLPWVKWDANSPLSNPKVIELLTQKTGAFTHYKNHENLNLSFTNLAGADLKGLKLAGSNLTATNLRGANLEGADLSDVRAVGADFTGAMLTGACLQNWRIDASTRLHDVNCRYVFLSKDDRDRQPASGEFEPGDFARLYQTVVDTFDLIFRNGLDWKIFEASLEEVRRTHPDANLTMQGVDTKGDGYVVIKLQVEGRQDKGHLHKLLKQDYVERLQAIEGEYQKRLEEQQEQIGQLINVADHLTRQPLRTNKGQTVLLSFIQGSLLEGLTVSAQVWSTQGTLLFTQVGQLPAAPELTIAYQRWQRLYQAQHPLDQDGFDPTPITNFSLVELNQSAKYLVQQLNRWLASASFLSIDQRLRSTLEADQPITVTCQTNDIAIQQLPLHCWRFFDAYPQAALTLSFLNTRSLPMVGHFRSQRRVLSVLGITSDIDVEQDGQILKTLPGVETCMLRQPSLRELTEALWEPRGWDIFCFSGHSALQGNQIWINEQESISLSEMEYALTNAIQAGLSIAIFNCCQGIRLARQFANVVSAGVVVMREPIPDSVAQVFLQYLVKHLENQQSLAHSLKNAREQLQGVEQDFPWVSWLPMAFWLP